MSETFGAFYIVFIIFCFVLAIAWIVLPFALIGTKPLLRDLIRETRRTNELLELRRQPQPSSSK